MMPDTLDMENPKMYTFMVNDISNRFIDIISSKDKDSLSKLWLILELQSITRNQLLINKRELK